MPVEELAQLRDKIWERAEEFFAEKKKTHAGMGEFIMNFLDELEDSLKGGKAIRGSLVCYGAICVGGKVTPAIIDLALATEMFHTFLLIHDDIIDRDDIRRGKPSFHERYKHLDWNEYLPSDPDHFGKSMGIVGGDILSTFGYELFMKADLPLEKKMEILEVMNQTVFETGVGEILDVLNDIRDNPSREHLMKVHTLKTSRYTFYSPLRIGAMAAGSSQEQLDVLKKYSLPMGIAYQLHDDILGLYGIEKKLGKPVYSDLREGKQTLLMIEAYRRATAPERRIIDQALGNNRLTESEAKAVKEIVKKTGSFEYSIELAHHFKRKALSALEVKCLTDDGHTFLCDIAEYIVNREY